MKLPRFRLRTAMLGMIALAIAIEVVGLGRNSRRYATMAMEAAEATQVNRRVIENSKIFAAQTIEQADRIASTDPTKASELRAKAEATLGNIPFFEAQAKDAEIARAAFDRAMTHPWEKAPAEIDTRRLASTPPARP